MGYVLWTVETAVRTLDLLISALKRGLRSGSGAARTARFQVRAPLSKRLMSVLLLASMMAPSPGVDSGLKLRRVATGLLWIRASEACSNNRRRFVKIRTGGVARHFVGNGSSCVCDSRVR